MRSMRLVDGMSRNQLRVAAEPALIPRQSAPDNAEFPLHDWWSWITPNRLFYVRSHFPVPRLDPAAWRLVVEGEVERPLSLGLSDLQSLPRQGRVVTLECAGNRRMEFEPRPPGVPWQEGAVSTAAWEGIALAEVLALARPRATAREVLLEGADEGMVAGGAGPIRFARSLPLERALQRGPLLADRMNESPLLPEHGAPLRAVVPGAYGMDSVKWLVRLRLLDRPFEGHFQVNDYRLFSDPTSGATVTSRPIGPVRVNSLIAWPGPGAALRVGEEVRVVGYAWSGNRTVVEELEPVGQEYIVQGYVPRGSDNGTIAEVELSVDGGGSWAPASLVGPKAPYAWHLWEASWRPETPGSHRLAVRAVDSTGAAQPEQSEWNAKGYANNRIYSIEVQVLS